MPKTAVKRSRETASCQKEFLCMMLGASDNETIFTTTFSFPKWHNWQLTVLIIHFRKNSECIEKREREWEIERGDREKRKELLFREYSIYTIDWIVVGALFCRFRLYRLKKWAELAHFPGPAKLMNLRAWVCDWRRSERSHPCESPALRRHWRLRFIVFRMILKDEREMKFMSS